MSDRGPGPDTTSIRPSGPPLATAHVWGRGSSVTSLEWTRRRRRGAGVATGSTRSTRVRIKRATRFSGVLDKAGTVLDDTPRRPPARLRDMDAGSIVLVL